MQLAGSSRNSELNSAIEAAIKRLFMREIVPDGFGDGRAILAQTVE